MFVFALLNVFSILATIVSFCRTIIGFVPVRFTSVRFAYSQALTCQWQVAGGTSRGVRPANADCGLAEWRCRVAWRGYPAVSSRPRQQYTVRDVHVRNS